MCIEIKIREVRMSRGITLTQLAKMTRISKSHLSNIERGEKEPTISVLVKISLALKVDIKKLYEIYI